ncbi:MAG: fasciclin domain-containing protein [Paludibacter sp.]|nr:fasciclin domain-containing protein [Paludibacter sp.]
MKKSVFIILIIAVIFTACADPFADNAFSTEEASQPAATYMENHDSLDVSLWVSLLKHADLFNTLNLQSGYTCFVPDNEAMQAFLTRKGYASVDDISVADAKLLIRYHTIPNVKYSSVDFEEGLISDSTATGDYLSTTFLDNGGQVQINTEAVIEKTVQVTNAYIHVIDAVLTPVTETIWDKLQYDGFSIFRQAVEATGFKEKLNTIYTTETANDITLLLRYRYTLFAVPDSVFEASDITSLAVLADSLKAGNDYTATDNKLYQYVAYHLLNQQESYYDLSYFSETDDTRSKNLNTMAENQLINVSEDNKTIYINYHSDTETGIELIKLNMNCKNGVMHVVNGLMKVESPTPTTLTWELTDYPDLSAISFYRVAAGTSTKMEYLSEDAFTCYTWLTVPESRAGLAYLLANKNESVMKSSLNSDYLVLSLGMYGWVEMESPAIIAGTYKVYIKHYNPKNTELLGKLSFIFDGEYLGSQITTIGNSKTTDKFVKTLIGEITFTETTTHTLRILAGDTYDSYLDCLTFEPVN